MINKKRLVSGAGRSSIWIMGIIILIALAVLIPLAKKNMSKPQVQGVSTSLNQNESIIGDILDNPNNYVGKQITLTGSVSNILNANALTLKASGINRNLLVVTSDSLLSPNGNGTNDYNYKDDDIVNVTGMVQSFDPVAIGNQLGVSFTGNEMSDYINKPVILAQSIAKFQNE